MNESKQTATLSFSDGSPSVEFPIYSGSVGPDVIDIRKLYGQTGKFTFDPGFMSTAACQSAITYIDGDKGELLYRGYPIEQLAVKTTFMEVTYLLLKGELPTEAQKIAFTNEIMSNSDIDPQLQLIFKAFKPDAHPMSVLTAAVGAMSAYYDSGDIDDPIVREKAAISLIGRLPTIVAMAYKHSQSEAFVEVDPTLSYSANFLRMMFGKPGQDYKPNDVLVRAIDRIFILHADHEQNASTSTVRLAGSSGTTPCASIAAGVACLWGPAHGGANEACLLMLESIGHIDNIPSFIEKVKDKNSDVRLMGFGHRVYKNYDPRAKLMRETCYEVLNELGLQNDPLFKLAMELERIALEDEYFISRKLYPNVDFYSGIVQRALGIPTALFTDIFALARTVGWISQWDEMTADPDQKIGRPRQLFTGIARRDI